MSTYCGKNTSHGHNDVATCGKPWYGTDAYQCGACVTKERDALRAEVEKLREDAERYRWLRDKSEKGHQFYLSVPLYLTGVRFKPEDVDRAIDTATGRGVQKET